MVSDNEVIVTILRVRRQKTSNERLYSTKDDDDDNDDDDDFSFRI